MNRVLVCRYVAHRFLKIPGVILGLVILSAACRPSIDDNIEPAPASSVIVTTSGSTNTTTTTTNSSSVTTPILLSPQTLTLTAGNSYTFTGSGGTGVYAYSILSGGGSINSSTGLFTAPSTTGTTVIRVTDTSGAWNQVSVTINSALAISPTTTNVVLNNDYTFSASGGTPPYTYSVVAGSATELQKAYDGSAMPRGSLTQGTIHASTGVYTAPFNSAMTETVRVTDALGNTSDATVTVIGKLVGGTRFACALLNGGVKCWGNAQTYGMIGDGQTTTNRTAPVHPTGLNVTNIKSIASGIQHTCVVFTDGSVQCWGANTTGQLGDGSTTTRSSPTAVSGLSSGVSQVFSGSGGDSSSPYKGSTCVLMTSGTLKCWGHNNYGQLGDGNAGVNRTTPYAITSLGTNVTHAATSTYNICAVKNGGVYCAGLNNSHQLNTGDTTAREAFVNLIAEGSGATQVEIGLAHLCALINGGVKCWGDNINGPLGIGYSTGTDQAPTWVPAFLSGSGVSELSAHGYYYSGNYYYQTCALQLGTPYCWGANYNGVLGLGSGDTAARYAPVTPINGDWYTNGTAVVSIQPTGNNGGQNNCVLYQNNRVQCLGENNEGTIGDGTTTDQFGTYTNTGTAGNPLPW